MKLAAIRFAEGRVGRIPYRVGRQLVAAAYGRRPDDVDTWPAGDYTDAIALLGVAHVAFIGGHQE